MSHFRLQLGTPEIDDDCGESDDWLRGLLSYLSLNDPKYKTIAELYIDHMERDSWHMHSRTSPDE